MQTWTTKFMHFMYQFADCWPGVRRPVLRSSNSTFQVRRATVHDGMVQVCRLKPPVSSIRWLRLGLGTPGPVLRAWLGGARVAIDSPSRHQMEFKCCHAHSQGLRHGLCHSMSFECTVTNAHIPSASRIETCFYFHVVKTTWKKIHIYI